MSVPGTSDLSVGPGEEVVLSASSDEGFSRYAVEQALSVEDVSNFPAIREQARIAGEISPNFAATDSHLIANLLGVAVTQSTFNDVTVEAGGRLVLNDAVNRIVARNITVHGEIVSLGHLSIEADQISGGSGITGAFVRDGSNGIDQISAAPPVDHGGDPVPAAPAQAPAGANAGTFGGPAQTGSPGDIGVEGLAGGQGLNGGNGTNGSPGLTVSIAVRILLPMNL